MTSCPVSITQVEEQTSYSDLRFLQPAIEFFRAVDIDIDDHGLGRPATAAKVVKAALAKALVHYYPLAGRLREAAGGKLAVECTGEGVVFVEAEADVSMDELGKPSPLPPYPCVEELLCEVGDPRVVLGVPLFFMQEALDFRWAKRVGGGLPMVGDISFDSVSCHMRCKNGKGQDVIVINMILPGPAMDKFEKEIAVWVCNGQDEK
uniref:Uncharacterized protein n=1 Tax=Aegilops tauschii subsp. strangulata TaxID=200361 RepID=A0A453TEB4_AEGTS